MKVNKFFAFSYLGGLLILFAIAGLHFLNKQGQPSSSAKIKDAVDYISIPVAQVSGSVEGASCEYNCSIPTASPSAKLHATSSAAAK